MPPSRSASPSSSAVPRGYSRSAVATSMACSGPWIPAALVPRVTMPQTFVIGLNGRTMSVPAASFAPTASHSSRGLTRWVRSGPQLTRNSVPIFQSSACWTVIPKPSRAARSLCTESVSKACSMTRVHGGSGPVASTTASYTSSNVRTARSPTAWLPIRQPRRTGAHLSHYLRIPVQVAAVGGVAGIGLIQRGALRSAVHDEFQAPDPQPVVAEPAARAEPSDQRQCLVSGQLTADADHQPSPHVQQPSLPRVLVGQEIVQGGHRLPDGARPQSGVRGRARAQSGGQLGSA